jgi:predicted DNA-binding transcriptional regulator AlpA
MTQDDDPLLTRSEIAEMYGVQPRTVAETWCTRPDFPKPDVRISQRIVRWRRSRIEAWATGELRSRVPTLGSTSRLADAGRDAR